MFSLRLKAAQNTHSDIVECIQTWNIIESLWTRKSVTLWFYLQFPKQEQKHLRCEELWSEEHLNVRGAHGSEAAVSVAGERRLQGGTKRREKDKEAFAEVAEARDIGIVAENIFVNSVSVTVSGSNSNVEKFMHSLNEWKVNNESFRS